MIVESATLLSTAISVGVGGAVSLLVTRATERHRGQLTASEREIEVRANFVTQLQESVRSANVRITELEQAIAMSFRREQELAQRYRVAEADLERRWRHLSNGLWQYALIIKARLEKHGEDVPPFTGWEKFLEEGGRLPPGWNNQSPDLG